MARLNLTEINHSEEMIDNFKNSLNEFLSYHPSFCKSVFSRRRIKLIDAIRFSLIQAAEDLLGEDWEEASDVDIEFLTIFEILNGEKPTGISCVKFNIKVVDLLIKKLEDRAVFNFNEANFILENAIKYRTENKGYLEFS